MRFQFLCIAKITSYEFKKAGSVLHVKLNHHLPNLLVVELGMLQYLMENAELFMS